ncbi:MAG: LLM class flavin-dependent oxidoreductase [Chloroflexota bacterium]|jgi:alkanesulfonate monooxygenase SsuD/methylene tetrahydromethanopterin reductase-like flavin-dependent oxidoreductase (luciferase family)
MPRPLQVGVQLPEIEYEPRWPDIARMAQLAEAIGLDSVWVGDHYLYRRADGPRGPWEAWTQLAAIAAVTSRVRIGPLVASTSFHAPGVLAKMAATVDEISGGRLILGLGAGWNETEYRAFGFPYDHRVARFAEAFTIIRTLLREGHIDFEGQYYTLRDCELLPRATRPGGPPLLVGSNGPRMLRLTMPHVQAWNAWYHWFGNRPQGLAEQGALVDAACAEVGRDPAAVERTAAVYVQLPGAVGARDFDRATAPPLRGSPEAVAAELRAFARAGIGHVQLVIDPVTPAGVESLAPVLEALDAD